MAFTPNRTLAPTIFAAARECRVGLGKRMQLRIAFAFASDEKLKELEQELTYEAVAAGAIPPTGVVDGIFVGNWQDLLQWIIDNWDSILKMIMAIIGLFAGPTIAGLLIAIVLLVVPATANAQCVGGVCRQRVLIERKVERKVVVERPVLRVLQPVRRVVHRERFLFWRPALRHHGE